MEREACVSVTTGSRDRERSDSCAEIIVIIIITQLTVLTLILHLGPYINYRVNITQYKLHNMSMRTLPLSAACIERLNALQPKQPCWSEGYLKPKPGTYCHLPDDVCRLCALWSLSLSLTVRSTL